MMRQTEKAESEENEMRLQNFIEKRKEKMILARRNKYGENN